MPLNTFLRDKPPFRGLTWVSLSEVAHVGANTYTQTGGGEATAVVTWGTALPCRVDEVAGAEGDVAEGDTDRSTHLITLPANTPVTMAGLISVDNRGTYEVTRVQDQTGELTRKVEVVAKT